MNEILNIGYEKETKMIKINGANEKALTLRYKALEDSKQRLYDYIKYNTLETAGREQALNDFLQKLKEE